VCKSEWLPNCRLVNQDFSPIIDSEFPLSSSVIKVAFVQLQVFSQQTLKFIIQGQRQLEVQAESSFLPNANWYCDTQLLSLWQCTYTKTRFNIITYVLNTWWILIASAFPLPSSCFLMIQLIIFTKRLFSHFPWKCSIKWTSWVVTVCHYSINVLCNNRFMALDVKVVSISHCHNQKTVAHHHTMASQQTFIHHCIRYWKVTAG
jgi:hypothetical protein